MDFTQKTYKELLQTLINLEYKSVSFAGVDWTAKEKVVVLRHDVDLLPQNSLAFAKIQHELGIKAPYYFRIVPESYNEKIIAEIADLGHEIGYHYEDLTLTNGDIDKAYDSFCRNLEKLRKRYPVKTICMHGSPRSKWDSRDIWQKYDYKKLGIIAEPYFDINFNEVFYLTDTGRRWDGWKVSIRDKVPQQEEWVRQGLVFHSTNQIIQAAKKGRLLSEVEGPDKVMMTFHPQRWTDKALPWVKELVWQGVKNWVKRGWVKRTK